MNIYLDNAATTQIDPLVTKAILEFQKSGVGNASSIHKFGLRAAQGVEKARQVIAKKINAQSKELIFTSGGTESNNLALLGVIKKDDHLIVSKIEHPSILEVAKYLESIGVRVTFLDVDKNGLVDPQIVLEKIQKNTKLVSIIHANNEIGTIQPIKEIGAICRQRNVLFHVDASQSFTKLEFDVENFNVDLATLSSHKIHGPKGVGCLFIRDGVKVNPLFFGGHQENGLRPGTYNSEGIVGFGKAVEISDEKTNLQVLKLRDYFIAEVEKNLESVFLTGSREKRICNNVNFVFEKVSGRELLTELNRRGIYVSMGSACFSNNLSPSSVLLAIGVDAQKAMSAIRFSLSKFNTVKEINIVVKNLKEIVVSLRNKSE